jgi:hypothetical protein
MCYQDVINCITAWQRLGFIGSITQHYRGSS